MDDGSWEEVIRGETLQETLSVFGRRSTEMMNSAQVNEVRSSVGDRTQNKMSLNMMIARKEYSQS